MTGARLAAIAMAVCVGIVAFVVFEMNRLVPPPYPLWVLTWLLNLVLVVLFLAAAVVAVQADE